MIHWKLSMLMLPQRTRTKPGQRSWNMTSISLKLMLMGLREMLMLTLPPDACERSTTATCGTCDRGWSEDDLQIFHGEIKRC